MSILDKACRYGDVEECSKICQANGDLAYNGTGELTPLHWLMLGPNNSEDVCKCIIDLIKGFGVNFQANDIVLGGSSQIEHVSGVTALHLAVLYKSASVVEKLLQCAANPDLVDSNGESSLMYASKSGMIDAVGVLVRHGADLTLLSNQGQSALTMSTNSDIRACILNSLNRLLLREVRRNGSNVQSILAAGGSINAIDISESDTGPLTPFLACIRGGNYEVILEMLNFGPDMSITDSPSTGNSALHELVLSTVIAPDQKVELIQEFAFLGADVNAKNKNDQTPLDLVLRMNSSNECVVKALTELGALTSVVPLPQIPLGAEPLGLENPTVFSDEGSPVSVTATKNDIPINLTELASRVGSLLAELEKAKGFAGGFTVADEERYVKAAAADTSEDQLLKDKLDLTSQLEKLVDRFDQMKISANVSSGGAPRDFRSIGEILDLQKRITSTRKQISQLNNRISNISGPLAVSSPRKEPTSVSTSWFRSPEAIESDIEQLVRVIRKPPSGNLVGSEGAIYELISKGGARTSASIPILKLLRNRGADINFRAPSSGLTALMVLCDTPGYDNEELLDWMLANSADPTLTDPVRGWSSLFFAASKNNLKFFEKISARLRKDKRSQGGVPIADKQGKFPLDYTTNPEIRNIVSGS